MRAHQTCAVQVRRSSLLTNTTAEPMISQISQVSVREVHSTIRLSGFKCPSRTGGRVPLSDLWEAVQPDSDDIAAWLSSYDQSIDIGEADLDFEEDGDAM